MTSEPSVSAEAALATAQLRRNQRRRAALRDLIVAIVVLWPVMLQIEDLPKRAENLRVLGPADPSVERAGGTALTGATAGAARGPASPKLVRLAQLDALPSLLEAHLPAAGAGVLIGEDANPADPITAGPDAVSPPDREPGEPTPRLPVFPSQPFVTGPGGGLPIPSGPVTPPVTPPANPTQPPIVTPPGDPPGKPPVVAPPDQPPIVIGVPTGPGGPNLPTNPGEGGPGGNDPSAVGGVPEPGLWVQMIVGCGVLGATLRRQRDQRLTALRARSRA